MTPARLAAFREKVKELQALKQTIDVSREKYVKGGDMVDRLALMGAVTKLDDASRDLPALLAEMLEALEEAQSTLRLFVGAAYPVSTDIDGRGHRWSEAYLDQALNAAMSKESAP